MKIEQKLVVEEMWKTRNNLGNGSMMKAKRETGAWRHGNTEYGKQSENPGSHFNQPRGIGADPI